MTDDALRLVCEQALRDMQIPPHEWDVDYLLRLLRQQQVETWRAARDKQCRLCREGYPLQRNGGWHNDKHGRDSLVNNYCLGAECEAQAREEET